ncbi:MAG: helix-turn-helix transcriptional regulator [Bacteroidales bacterium]|nr:helix-turn-helix transcriptional regulator [Bacteroidales bacterium]
MFIVSEMLKEARKEANLTQEQLAEKAGTKMNYISKIENAKGNIQLSTLIRFFEKDPVRNWQHPTQRELRPSI